MDYSSHVTEEQMIDFVLEETDEGLRSKISNHIESCEGCRQMWNSWTNVLNDNLVHDQAPSLPVKKTIKQKLDKTIGTPSKSKCKKPFNFSTAFVIASCTVLLFLVFGLYNEMRSQDMSYKVVQQNETLGIDIQNRPNTNRVDITPASDYKHVSGNVWVDNTTNEMLVEVNGLSELSSNDYQLWVIYSDDHYQGELLQTQDGEARLFYKGGDLTQLKHIKASIEPIGGSEVPTGPDTFFVDFE